MKKPSLFILSMLLAAPLQTTTHQWLSYIFTKSQTTSVITRLLIALYPQKNFNTETSNASELAAILTNYGHIADAQAVKRLQTRTRSAKNITNNDYRCLKHQRNIETFKKEISQSEGILLCQAIKRKEIKLHCWTPEDQIFFEDFFGN